MLRWLKTNFMSEKISKEKMTLIGKLELMSFIPVKIYYGNDVSSAHV